MKEVMVTVDSYESCQQRVEIAASYASEIGAHLTGLFVTPDIKFPAYVSGGIVAKARKQHDAEFEERAEIARKIFHDAAEKFDVGAGLLALQGDYNEVITGHSRCADLLVMGQAKKDQGETAGQIYPDKVILQSGRPVLVTPFIKCDSRQPKRVAVAWDGSREATRALHDAMPILRLAKTVELITVAEPQSATARYADVDLVLAQLARHDVNAKSYRIPDSSIGIGNLLLNRVVDSAADLLVTGAYGHTRLRELVMGGVTQELLEHCSVPLLMSR
ncbi:MAG: universal stress protein UspA [Proteobacteria bacterium]|nr:MAG: universal stress protein UspA [Pseudomonadota bacterium]